MADDEHCETLKLSLIPENGNGNGKIVTRDGEIKKATAAAEGSSPSSNNSIMDWLRARGRSACSKKQLYKKVPITEWLPKYNVEKGVADLIAGLTVGLTVIPQGIAYALVANLPPQVF
jgi:hypothetical protein